MTFPKRVIYIHRQFKCTKLFVVMHQTIQNSLSFLHLRSILDY